VNLKRLIVLIVVAFLLFFLITNPGGSANVVDNILGWLKNGAQSIVTFVQQIFS
jgi:cell shape-determining protein MreC